MKLNCIVNTMFSNTQSSIDLTYAIKMGLNPLSGIDIDILPYVLYNNK